MPLEPGSSPAVISRNIHELSVNGTRKRSHAQIVAIALHNASKHRRATGDHGTRGHMEHDHVMVPNAHPHQDHPIGFEDKPFHPGRVSGHNHGIRAFHVDHDRRDKLAEHHPPVGLE